MDLNMRTIHYFETVLEGSAAKEETADIIVPDLYPDIARVLDTSGIAVIKEKMILDGRVKLAGAVRASVLYVPEGEQGLKKIDVSLPFSHSFEQEGITPESKILTRAALLMAEARPINPRKVQVTVTVQLDVTGYAVADWSLCEGVDDANTCSAQLLKSAEQAWMPVAFAERSFQVTDEVEVTGSRPPIIDILKTDVRLAAQEVKSVGNKLVFKGAAFIRVLYVGPAAEQPGEGIHLMDTEIPFSQIIEMEMPEEGGSCSVNLKLCAMEIDLRGGLSGESRLIDVSLQIEAQAICVEMRKLEAVVDLYSTAYEARPEFRTYQVNRLLEKSTRHQNIRESLETSQPVASVVDAQAILWPVSQKQESGTVELSAQAMVKVVYLGDDGQFYALNRRLPVGLQWEADGASRYRIVANVGSEVQATGTHEGVEVRFTVDFEVEESQIRQFTAISAVSVDTQSPKTHMGLPSVVLRRCRTGESLWHIAKKYNTTRADLIEANHLSGEEEICEERVLLIPRKR